MARSALADRLERAMSDHVAPGTAKTYQSVVRRFEVFVRANGGSPAFPVQAVWVAAWVLFASMTVSVPSMRAYLSALRYVRARPPGLQVEPAGLRDSPEGYALREEAVWFGGQDVQVPYHT